MNIETYNVGKSNQQKITLQIQTVLYNNEKKNLLKSMLSIENAIRVGRSKHCPITDFLICYGDASKQPIYNDNEIKEIQEKFSQSFRFQYVFFDENTGTSKGHNRLAQGSKSDYLLLMNPDILFTPECFIYLMQPFEESADIGIVEARQTPIEHPKYYDEKTGETSWASGACGIIKTDLFQKVGGYDEKTFFMYCDDVDLSWRIKLIGKRIVYQPLAPVYHPKRLSSKATWQATAAEEYYSAEASLLLSYKWSNMPFCLKLLRMYKKSKNVNRIKAVEAFEKKMVNGTLPMQIDPHHSVSIFDGFNYEKRRFNM